MGNEYDRRAPKFLELNELSSANSGARILFATDDFFAVAENLLKEDDPVWKEDLFTEHGKWMDGWETRRKRREGHDWTIIALSQPSVIEGFCVDTAFFTGNYVPRFSIQGARLTKAEEQMFPTRNAKMGSSASEETLRNMAALKTEDWETLVPMTKLRPGYPETRKSYFTFDSSKIWTHVRLNLYPDGGIARLRIYGLAAPDWSNVLSDSPIDLLDRGNGAVCEEYTNAHYGHPRNIIKGGKAKTMADGWETARRLDRPPVITINNTGLMQAPGEEWAIFRLGHVGSVESIVIDTAHFKGNFPDSCKVEGVLVSEGNCTPSEEKWITVMPSTKLSAHQIHTYTSSDLNWHGPMSHVKLTIYPDGGISRFKLYGYRKQ